MNPIAPAYSVIAQILIILVLTLAGYPASVFVHAQTEASDVVNNSGTADELLPDTATGAEETDSEATTTEPAATPVTNPAPYQIEKLMSDRVYSDFVVGPGRFELEIAPGQSQTVEILVTNRMGIPKTFYLSTEDISGNSNTDQAVVLLGDEVGPYSLKDFISVPSRSFVLQHAERARIPVTVTIPADAEPGGFYGSLLTEIISEEVDQPDPQGALPSSRLISRIGTLFFITTPGILNQSLEVKDFSAADNQRFFTKGPINFNIVTENAGTVHATPFGLLRIYNTLGNEVGYVELQPWYVLPGALRNKEVTWNREFLIGRYTAVAEINRGFGDAVDTVSYSFWVIPLEFLGGVFAGLFVFFLLLRFFFSRFEFKRKGN